jgi:hypothetical protein
LSDYYNVSILTAGSDLDEFLEELIEAGVIKMIRTATVDSVRGAVTQEIH